MLGSIKLNFSRLVVVLYVTVFLTVRIWCDRVYARQLERNSILIPSEDKEKANLLNVFFSSVYTMEHGGTHVYNGGGIDTAPNMHNGSKVIWSRNI